MSTKVSPAKAFEAAQVLLPGTIRIERGNKDYVVLVTDNLTEHLPNNIDWPEGVYQWPLPKKKKKWRDAVMPQDWGKPARFSDYPNNDESEWTKGGTLIAGRYTTGQWISNNGLRWKYCQVEDDTCPCDCDDNKGWRFLEEYEHVMEGDEFASLEMDFKPYPVVSWAWGRGVSSVTRAPGTQVRRKIVTERNGIVSGDGYRLLDGEELLKLGDEYYASNKWNYSLRPGHGDYRQASDTYRRKL